MDNFGLIQRDKGSKSIAIHSRLQSNIKDVAVKLKNYEHRTSNVQHRILNKEFCQFINWRSTSVPQHKLTDFIHAKAWFDVQKHFYSADPKAQRGTGLNLGAKGDGVEFRRFFFSFVCGNEATCHVKTRDFCTLVYKLLLSF